MGCIATGSIDTYYPIRLRRRRLSSLHLPLLCLGTPWPICIGCTWTKLVCENCFSTPLRKKSRTWHPRAKYGNSLAKN